MSTDGKTKNLIIVLIQFPIEKFNSALQTRVRIEDEDDEDIDVINRCCSLFLTGLSLVLIAVTFPFSLCYVIKQVQVNIFKSLTVKQGSIDNLVAAVQKSMVSQLNVV